MSFINHYFSVSYKTLLSRIACLWLVWRGLLFLVAWFAPVILSYQPSFPYSEILQQSGLPPIVYNWANFDGVHYLTIARDGYFLADLTQAFFPIFPLLVRFFYNIGINSIVGGLIISNLCLIGAMFFGFKLTKKWFNQQTAIQFLLVLLTFPTSFYFGAMYSESLFLLLILAGVWYYETKKNAISGLLIGLSSGVRLAGLMMIPAVFLEWMKKIDFRPPSLKKIFNQTFNIFKTHYQFLIGLLIGLTAFGGYALFLYLRFDDPLYFFSVQSEFGAGRETRIILLPQVFYRSLRILLTARPFDLKYFSYAQDFVLSLLMGLGVIAAASKIKLSYIAFAGLAYLLPTLTGNLSSMPRYVLVLFPVLMWWSSVLVKKPNLKMIYYPASILLLVINIVLFVQGYWVA